MKPDPCQKQLDEWMKAADRAQELKNEYDSGYAYKKYGETVQKREQYAQYLLAQKRADQLHEALGKCYEKYGVR
jgi:hypothetical protein